ncbi:MAG: hypothetical protein ABIH34_03395 [Nanoarchaeota archaeon]
MDPFEENERWWNSAEGRHLDEILKPLWTILELLDDAGSDEALYDLLHNHYGSLEVIQQRLRDFNELGSQYGISCADEWKKYVEGQLHFYYTYTCDSAKYQPAKHHEDVESDDATHLSKIYLESWGELESLFNNDDGDGTLTTDLKKVQEKIPVLKETLVKLFGINLADDTHESHSVREYAKELYSSLEKYHAAIHAYAIAFDNPFTSFYIRPFRQLMNEMEKGPILDNRNPLRHAIADVEHYFFLSRDGKNHPAALEKALEGLAPHAASSDPLIQSVARVYRNILCEPAQWHHYESFMTDRMHGTLYPHTEALVRNKAGRSSILEHQKTLTPN